MFHKFKLYESFIQNNSVEIPYKKVVFVLERKALSRQYSAQSGKDIKMVSRAYRLVYKMFKFPPTKG